MFGQGFASENTSLLHGSDTAVLMSVTLSFPMSCRWYCGAPEACCQLVSAPGTWHFATQHTWAPTCAQSLSSSAACRGQAGTLTVSMLYCGEKVQQRHR